MNNPIYYTYGARLNFPSTSGIFIDNSDPIMLKKYAEAYYPGAWKFGLDATNDIFVLSRTQNITRPFIFNKIK